MSSFIVKELPIYPVNELQTELNKVLAANAGATLVQAFEQKAGSGLTGRTTVNRVPDGGTSKGVHLEVRTTAVFVFFVP